MKRCPTCLATYRKAPLRCPLDQTPLVDQIDERLGQQIGSWTLLELIMEGNLATVYKVEREGVIGALKIYSPAAPMQRAWREGEHQSRVVHPNVAVLLDQGITGEGEIFSSPSTWRGRLSVSSCSRPAARPRSSRPGRIPCASPWASPGEWRRSTRPT